MVYVNHTLSETYEKYGSKIKRIWLLNGNEVDINNYNPVSTILESEE